MMFFFFFFFSAVMSCQTNSSITYNLKAKSTKKPRIELDEVREIPGFRVIMKAVLRSQIQYLVSISLTHPPLVFVAAPSHIRAYHGSEFVIANTLAKWKKLEPNEINFRLSLKICMFAVLLPINFSLGR